MLEKSKRKRVNINLWREQLTSEGLVLEYLQSKHPSGLSASDGVMATLLQHWLPVAMKENGMTREEYQKAAAYSVRQIMAQLDWIASECDLPPLLLRQGDRTIVLSSNEQPPISERLPEESDRLPKEERVTTSGELIDEDDEDYRWLDEPDNLGIDLSDMVVDAGFRS